MREQLNRRRRSARAARICACRVSGVASAAPHVGVGGARARVRLLQSQFTPRRAKEPRRGSDGAAIGRGWAQMALLASCMRDAGIGSCREPPFRAGVAERRALYRPLNSAHATHVLRETVAAAALVRYNKKRTQLDQHDPAFRTEAPLVFKML